MKYFMLLLAVGVWGQTQYYPPPSGTGGSFTAATEAEAIAGTSNTPGMTPLRVADAIKANVEGGDGVTCTTTTAGVECAVNGTVVRVSSGLASAKPGSCTALSQVYVASDTGAVYWCDGDTYEIPGGAHFRRLCTFGVATGITATSNTADVPAVTACSIPAGTIQAGDDIECYGSVSRGTPAGTDNFGFTTAWLVGATTVNAGHATTSSTTTQGVKMVLVVANPTTSVQTYVSQALASSGSHTTGTTNTSAVSTGTLDTTANAMTIAPRTWTSGTLGTNTVTWNGGSCWIRKAN